MHGLETGNIMACKTKLILNLGKDLSIILTIRYIESTKITKPRTELIKANTPNPIPYLIT